MTLLQYNFHGRDLSATVQNALDVVNAADLVRTHLVAHTLYMLNFDHVHLSALEQII